jgi:hypothetical protein
LLHPGRCPDEGLDYLRERFLLQKPVKPKVPILGAFWSFDGSQGKGMPSFLGGRVDDAHNAKKTTGIFV